MYWRFRWIWDAVREEWLVNWELWDGWELLEKWWGVWEVERERVVELEEGLAADMVEGLLLETTADEEHELEVIMGCAELSYLRG